MEELKSVNSQNKNSNEEKNNKNSANNSNQPDANNNSQSNKQGSKPAQTNVKLMTPQEQVEYYKSLFQKSKKLNKYYDEEIENLKKKLSQYEGETGKICELLFIFKYTEEDIFYFFNNPNTKNKYFLNEKMLADSIASEIKKNPSNKLIDYSKDIINKDNYLNQIILQYEDKLKRILTENELNESKVKDFKTQIENLQNNYNELKEKFALSIQYSIQSTNDILINLKNIQDVDLHEENVKNEIYSKIKNNIENLSANNNSLLNDSLNEASWFHELVEFNKKILKSYLDTVFNIVDIEISEISAKNKYQNTIDQLILNQQEEKNKSFQTVEQYQITIRTLNQKISLLEQEKYNLAKQKDLSLEILKKQINKGVNMNYLKNIFISFLTTKDENIQEGLLPVIYTTLQFNENEIKQVKTARNKNNLSIFSLFK